MPTIPRIISVDDHVVEPPTLWSDRLPRKYRDRGPRIVRDRARFRFVGGHFRACEETETVVNLHIGSSSKMPSTSSDAPHGVGSVLTFSNTMGSMLDLLISGLFDRFPRLRGAYSEGQVGWMPFVLERTDKLWEQRRGVPGYATDLARPPSTYIEDHIWGCIFDDLTGLRLRDEVGMGQITFEIDYPHADTTFPYALETATALVEAAGLDQHEVDQLFRTNAIRAYGLERFGITA